MSTDPMLNSASAYLNGMNINESDSDEDTGAHISLSTSDPSSLNTFTETSTNTKEILISNLREPYAANNVKKVLRIGTYNPKEKPRQIIVSFESEDDQKEAILNAEKLKTIDEWKHLEVLRQSEQNRENQENDSEKENLKQQLAEIQKQMALLKQQMPNTTFEQSKTSSISNFDILSQSGQPINQNNVSQMYPQYMPFQQTNGYPTQSNVVHNFNESTLNPQTIPQMPFQNSTPFQNPAMPYDMMTMFQMYQSYTAANTASSLTPTAPPLSEPPTEIESSSESEEESSSEESEDEPEVLKIENQLFKSQSERHIGTKKTLNILVLGETGVGKSTWINGIANYMSFDTLEDALNAPQPICLIASKFAFYETNEDKIEVVLEPSHGEKDKNEAFSDQGQSSTQEPKTYQFETSKYIVNIIDTPGIGDTRGVDQDKENTRKILNAIGQYKDLHAICFLFKANEARMTLSFRYCISELLLQLHKDAVDNIIFFFTNARGTFYKPGDTMTPLSEFLSELQNQRGLRISLAADKICCTDNEAFRLVCAHFNGAKFTEEDFLNFAGSWKQSAAETHRFIEFAARQRPHHVADTVSINKARTIILHLAKPLADVNELIESNIKVFDDRKKDLYNTANDLNALKKKLKVTQIGIEVKSLDYPKTVCAAQRCIETQRLGNTEQLQVVYKTICHDHCYLTGVNVEKVPEPALVHCAAMSGRQNCHVCSCHWSTHMHIRFDQIKATIEVEDKNTKTLIQKNEDAAKVKEKMIKDCENTIDELKAEQQKIIKTSLRFGSFLQANAILPYNDAFEKYVEQTISEEEKCTEVGGDRSKLDNLKKLLAEYRQEKALLSEAAKNPVANASSRIAPDEIDVMKAKLFGLKNTGKTLKNLFHATENGIALNNAHVTVKYIPPRKPLQPVEYGKYKYQSNKKENNDKPKREKKGRKNKNKNKYGKN
uniref:G domain-containing protein n=1 Tax=Panagrolaimus sp. PS1159 TaxID=55785 RepID=A0AC35GX90_9BILA